MTKARLRCPAGTPDATRVLLLHGLGGRPSVWDRFCDHLTGSVELWDVELPWHGMAGSEWSHGADPVAILAGVIGHRGFDVLVAHSYSAILLAEALATGRVDRRPAVLISPFYRSSAEEFDWPTISYYLNGFHRTFGEALRLGETSRFPAAYRDWMALRLRDQVGPYGWMRFFEAYLRSPFLDLAAITTPVLVLSGGADIAAHAKEGRALAAAVPDGRFALLDGCGHFPMLEQPRSVARIVEEFLVSHQVSALRRTRSEAAEPHLELT
jgi:pimeloyl-ACP methyl ester carboxylesterase